MTKIIKFQNIHGKTGRFSFEDKRYTYVGGVFAVESTNKKLIQYFQKASSWKAYAPNAEDKVLDLKAENEALKASLTSTEDKKLISELESKSEHLAEELEKLHEQADEAVKTLKAENAELKESVKANVRELEEYISETDQKIADLEAENKALKNDLDEATKPKK